MSRFLVSSLCMSLISLNVISSSGCGKESAKDTSQKAASNNVESKTSKKSESNTSPKKQETKSTGKFEIKFKDGEGNAAYYLKYDGEDGKLLDGDKKEICRYKKTTTKFKVLDADQNIIGHIAAYPNRYKIEDESGKEMLEYQQSGSDWKLKQNETMMLRIKSRDYGFESEKPDDTSYNKVKVKDGKKSLRDASENTIFYTKDKLRADAMVPLGFKAIDAQHRFALALAIQIGLGQE